MRKIFLIALLIFCWSNIAQAQSTNAGMIQMEFKSPIKNFHVVGRTLARGAQPNEVGIKFLKDHGTDVIINLRGDSDDTKTEQKICNQLGIQLYVFSLSGLFPDPAKIKLVESLLEEELSSGHLVYIHCLTGVDRTGTVIAIYRMHHGWPEYLAYAEAKFDRIHFWQIFYKQYIKKYSNR